MQEADKGDNVLQVSSIKRVYGCQNFSIFFLADLIQFKLLPLAANQVMTYESGDFIV